nr:carbohydrate ABC transporter permease [uncultured Blautia sp.]
MKNKKIKWGHVIIFIILVLCMVVTLLPFIWMILTSLKTQSESICIPIKILPEKPLFSNYAEVFEKIPFARMYLNTMISAGVIVVAQLILCSMAAYAFGRIKFPGRDIIFGILLAVLMVPSSFFMLPQYLIIQKMGLLNTLPALFIPGLFSAFGTFLMRQFFMALPNDLEEAARIDGCGHFRIFTRIMFPLVKPGLVALAILTLRGAWNDLMWPMIVNTSPEKMTLSAGLSFLQGQYATDYPTMMAGAVLAVIPLLVLFAIFQKQFIEGIALQGIKG